MISTDKLLKLRKCVHLIERPEGFFIFATRANRVFSLSSEEAEIVKFFLSNDAVFSSTAFLSYETDDRFLNFLYENCVIDAVDYSEPVLRSLVLLVSEACNFDCTYCYGSYGTRQKKMNIETAIRAIDLSLELGIRDIVFFGGEPLTNFIVIKQAVEHIEQSGYKNITLRMTTNGSLVTEDIANYLRLHHFQVSVSMDGDQSSQDLTRVYPNNNSTYEDVICGIKKLKENNVLSLLEVTYSARHTNLKQQLRSALDLFPVVSCACVDGSPKSKQSRDIITGKQFNEFYRTLLDFEQCLCEGETLLGAKELYDRICNGEPLTIPKYLCSDIGTRLIVTPEGNVVPCPEMAEKPEYIICNVNSQCSSIQFQDLRMRVLEKLTSERIEKKWYTGLCETCIQHVKEKKDRFEYIDDEAFQSCIESLILRYVDDNT